MAAVSTLHITASVITLQGSRSGSQTLMAEEALEAQQLSDPASSFGTLRHAASDMSQTGSQQATSYDATAPDGAGSESGECGLGMHQSAELSMQSDGLYAAAAKVPTEMKAAWKEEMERPQKGKQVAAGKQKGRRYDEKTVLPIKLLKCLQGKTLSDVEAQMHALGVDKHLH